MRAPLSVLAFLTILPSALAQSAPSPVPWVMVRILGLTAFFLLSLTIFIAVSKKAFPRPSFSRLFRYHHNISLTAVGFVLAHGLANTLDKYSWALTLRRVLLPDFSSPLNTWISFGVMAMYVLVILAITSIHPRVQRFLKYRNWYAIHLFSYVAYVFVIIHAWKIGSDIRNISGIPSVNYGLLFLFWGSIAANAAMVGYFVFRRVRKKKPSADTTVKEPSDAQALK